MQNWKIKRMSGATIKEWLDKIDELLRHYKGKQRVGNCPLCRDIDCDECLWVIIEGMNCDKFAGKLYGNYEQEDAEMFRDDLRFKKWKDARLEQLPRWKKILQAELARRKQ